MFQMEYIGTLIAAWSQGKPARIWDNDYGWREVTPDNLKAWTGHNWVTLRAAIDKYDERKREQHES